MTRTALLACLVCTPSLFGQLVAVHPDAISQASAWGATLHTLHAAGGKIYIGYGDYATNTGPINIRYFDPTTDRFSDVLVTGSTESFNRFRTIGDQVLAPHNDPRDFESGGFALGPVGTMSGWSELRNIDAFHFFDVAKFDNRLFLAAGGGSGNELNSRIFVSGNAGQTWQVSINQPAAPCDTMFCYSRFYGLTVLEDTLYTQRVVENSGWGTMMAYDGQNWSNVTPVEVHLPRLVELDTFAGHVIGLSDERNLAPAGLRAPGSLFVLDGAQLEAVDQGAARVWDHAIDGDTIYLLRDDGHVVASQDLENWATVFTEAPRGATSLAVLGDHLYLGGSAATLYRFSLPVEPSGCDLNADTVCNGLDIDLLSDMINSGEYTLRFDLDRSGRIDQSDRAFWIHDLMNSYFGDSNLDGEFNTKDFVAVFQAGEFEDGLVTNSRWATGDWNGDREFGSSDFVLAFQDGGFEKGVRVAVAAVPEPASLNFWLWFAAMCRILRARFRPIQFLGRSLVGQRHIRTEYKPEAQASERLTSRFTRLRFGLVFPRFEAKVALSN